MTEIEKIAAGNVLVPAILALRRQSFAVSLRQGALQEWVAERSNLTLLAQDPMQLLGLGINRWLVWAVLAFLFLIATLLVLK